MTKRSIAVALGVVLAAQVFAVTQPGFTTSAVADAVNVDVTSKASVVAAD